MHSIVLNLCPSFHVKFIRIIVQFYFITQIVLSGIFFRPPFQEKRPSSVNYNLYVTWLPSLDDSNGEECCKVYPKILCAEISFLKHHHLSKCQI